MIKLLKLFILFVSVILVTNSCYREEALFYYYNGEVLNFSMTEEQENGIYTSRSSSGKYYVNEPLPLLQIGKHKLEVDQFSTRGQSTLNFRKKSFSVNLDKTVEWKGNDKITYAEKFKLLSLVFDYTYIEHVVAAKFFDELDLWPYHTFFIEVALNNNHQGLYLFIPDPEDLCIDELNANFVIRKGYHNSIRRSKISAASPHSEAHYKAKYDSIYTLIANYDGEILYSHLSKIIDLETYFRKLAVDFLLRNGDYTDEAYLYTVMKDGHEVFTPIPWDYDDIFSEFPHEVNRDWAPGKLFGTRVYHSMDDIYADVGDLLLFSIEEDLDYKIAKDSYLYQKYVEQVAYVYNKINTQTISRIFNEAFNEVIYYYETLDLEELSKYDEQPTSLTKLRENISEKEQIIHEQHEIMRQKLNQL